MYIRNNNGPSTLPCGIPLVTASQSEKLLLTLTLNFLLFKKSVGEEKDRIKKEERRNHRMKI